jgi:hypothetical protein
VVFNEQLNDFVHEANPDFERRWLDIASSCKQRGDDPIAQARRLGEPFFSFAVDRALDDLNERAVTFEHYLVNSMFLRTLKEWDNVISGHLNKSLIVYGAAEISQELQNEKNLKLSSFRYFVDLIGIVPDVQFIVVVQHFLPLIVTKERRAEFHEIEGMWSALLDDCRTSMVMPETLRNVKLQKKLWDAIETINCLNQVEFWSTLRLILEALSQLQELERIEPMAMQMAIVYSEFKSLPCMFVLINCLVIRQNFIQLFSEYENEIFLWHKLEAAILKVMAGDDALMSAYLHLENHFMSLQYE